MRANRLSEFTRRKKILLGLALLVPVALISVAPKVWHRLRNDDSPTLLPAKASDRREGKDAAVLAMSSQEAAAELRRMCLSKQVPLELKSLQDFYDIRRLRALVRLLDQDDVRALRAAPELTALEDKPYESPSLARILLAELGERGSELAPAETLSMDRFNGPGGVQFKSFEFLTLLKGAAKGGPEAAMAFWKEHLRDPNFSEEEIPFSPNYLGRVIEGAATSDPAKAWALLNGLDESTRSDQVIASYFGALSPGSEWGQAVEQLQSCGPVAEGGVISPAAVALARAWMRDDPAAAMRWLDSVDDSLRAARGDALPHRSSPYGNKAAVYAEVIGGWLQEDPIEAIHWLREWTPADVTKVQVLREAMNGCAPVFERELLEVSGTPEEREKLVLALARDARGSEEFDSLMAAGGVSKATLDELRRMKERFSPAEHE
jgi:hypothetical protein